MLLLDVCFLTALLFSSESPLLFDPVDRDTNGLNIYGIRTVMPGSETFRVSKATFRFILVRIERDLQGNI